MAQLRKRQNRRFFGIWFCAPSWLANPGDFGTPKYGKRSEGTDEKADEKTDEKTDGEFFETLGKWQAGQDEEARHAALNPRSLPLSTSPSPEFKNSTKSIDSKNSTFDKCMAEFSSDLKAAARHTTYLEGYV
jgi:hypothetical protein